jgi:hypothetical protein
VGDVPWGQQGRARTREALPARLPTFAPLHLHPPAPSHPPVLHSPSSAGMLSDWTVRHPENVGDDLPPLARPLFEGDPNWRAGFYSCFARIAMRLAKVGR